MYKYSSNSTSRLSTYTIQNLKLHNSSLDDILYGKYNYIVFIFISICQGNLQQIISGTRSSLRRTMQGYNIVSIIIKDTCTS